MHQKVFQDDYLEKSWPSSRRLVVSVLRVVLAFWSILKSKPQKLRFRTLLNRIKNCNKTLVIIKEV